MPPYTQTQLDPKIISAWTEAGALVGWLSRSEFGEWQYLKAPPPNVDSLPVFFWPKQEFEAAVIAELPAPSAPFAMCLQLTRLKNNRLHQLGGLQNLEDLDLSHANLTDIGLWRLQPLSNLRSVDLGATAVTDEGLKILAEMQNLQNLYFGSTAVTDAGLGELTCLDELRTLYLYNPTSVTDAGLQALAGVESLQTLLLYRTQVTDAGLKEISGLPNLHTLGLNSTAVTDAGLVEIAGPGFRSLRTVHIPETKTTEDGRAQLARDRPGLRILF